MHHCRNVRLNGLAPIISLLEQRDDISVKMTGKETGGFLRAVVSSPLTSSIMSLQPINEEKVKKGSEWNYILSLFNLRVICVGADSLGPNSGR